MSGPTSGTRLAACLQEAGMACLTCGGYGSTVVSEDFAYVHCPECGGDGIAPEHRQEVEALTTYADEEARTEHWPTDEEQREHAIWQSVTTLRDLAPDLLSDKAATL